MGEWLEFLLGVWSDDMLEALLEPKLGLLSEQKLDLIHSIDVSLPQLLHQVAVEEEPLSLPSLDSQFAQEEMG